MLIEVELPPDVLPQNEKETSFEAGMSFVQQVVRVKRNDENENAPLCDIWNDPRGKELTGVAFQRVLFV